MSDFKARRDQAADASVTHYNHKDPWMQYEMRRCGQLSFVEGADWAYAEAQAEIAQLKESIIIEQVGSMHYLGERDAHIKESETFVKDATAKINEQAKEIEQLKAEIEQLRSPRKS